MTTKKKGLAWALAALTMGLLAGRSWAVNAIPDSDSLTITITPAVELAVDLDTATAKMDTSSDLTVSLALNATSFLVSPATATIKGNFNRQEVEVTAQGFNTWGIDTDEVIEADKVQVYALFAVDKASRPLEAEFGQGGAGRHLITGAVAKLAGEPTASEAGSVDTNNTFKIENGDMAGAADMDNMAVNAVRQLWLRVDTPSSTTSDEAQQIQVTLTAVSGTTR